MTIIRDQCNDLDNKLGIDGKEARKIVLAPSSAQWIYRTKDFGKTKRFVVPSDSNVRLLKKYWISFNGNKN